MPELLRAICNGSVCGKLQADKLYYYFGGTRADRFPE